MLDSINQQTHPHSKYPLLENLAADIFCNTFSPKFLVAAKTAAAFVCSDAEFYRDAWGLSDVYSTLLSTVEIDFGELIKTSVRKSRIWKSNDQYWLAQSHQTIQWAQVVCGGNMVTMLQGFAILPTLSNDDISTAAERCLKMAKVGSGIHSVSNT